MSINNLISISFSEEETTQMQNALNTIASILKGKTVNLTPEDRKQYGAIADNNKKLVNKCRDYMEQRPDLIPKTLDHEEFKRDFKARETMERLSRSLFTLQEEVLDTKTLLDHDNYKDSISFYRYIKFLSQENEPGSSSIFADLKKHFSSGSRPITDKTQHTGE